MGLGIGLLPVTPDDARDCLGEAICLFRDEVRPATREALIQAAVDALVAGVNSPALAELAGARPDDAWSELDQTVAHVVHELDLHVPTHDQALRIQLRRQLAAVVSGAMSPREVAAWAHDEFGHDSLADALPFVNADDEYDVAEYTSRSVKEIDAYVLEHAHRFLSRKPDGPAAERSRSPSSTAARPNVPGP